MAIISPVPLYRFFDNQEFAVAMAKNGELFFNVVSAFPNLQDSNFQDSSEGIHLFKHVVETSFPFGKSQEITHRNRKISDAWAFCATSSPVSTAKKGYCVWIKDFKYLINQIDIQVKEMFGEELFVMFGPVSYYSNNSEVFSKVQLAPFFTKSESFKNDLEFRIVITPTSKIRDKGKLSPIKLQIPNPSHVFEEVLIIPLK